MSRKSTKITTEIDEDNVIITDEINEIAQNEEINEEVNEKINEEKVKTSARKKAVKIDRDEMIPCRSIVFGELTYISSRTKLSTIWSDFGVVEYVEFGELLTMKASQPKFFSKPWIIIEDEDAVDALGLRNDYNKMMSVKDIGNFFNKKPQEFEALLKSAPQGIKDLIATQAREKIANGTLHDIRLIRIIDRVLGTGLKDLID
jgi:hypothetical protein